MSVFYLVFIGIIGLLIGSFLNATAGRWGTSRQNAPRSKCFYCGYGLRAKNLIPIFSWLFQRGRCSECFSKISTRYLLVELFIAATFIGLFIVSQSAIQLLFLLVVSSLMILIALIDFDQFIIPHELSVPLIILSFTSLFISPITLSFVQPELWSLLAGPILASFFWSLWLLTRGRGMGFADGTLALSIGWLLGISAGITAVMVSFWLGTIISLGIMVYQKMSPKGKGAVLTLKSAIPFGPYLVMGFIITLVTSFNLFASIWAW